MSDLPDGPADPAVAGESARTGVWTTALIVGGFALVVLLVLAPDVAEQLLLGWLYFLIRVLPQVTVDWPTALLGIGCAVAFVVGLHWALRRSVRPAADSAAGESRGWSLRSSAACAAGLLLIFAAGTAMVGTTHQAVWLATGRVTRNSDSPPVFGFVAGARRAARTHQHRGNLKTVGIAIHNFHDTEQMLPPGGSFDQRGRLMHGWAIYLGPYLSYSNAEVDFSAPWNEPPNDRLYRCALPMYLNPAIPEVFDAEGFGLSHVAGNVQVLPVVPLPRAAQRDATDREAWKQAPSAGRPFPVRFDDMTDGLGHTLLIGEVATQFKPWGYPANIRDPARGIGRSPDGFGGPPGAGGALFLMCDGSVRRLGNATDPQVLRGLSTPAGGELLPPEFPPHEH